MKQKARFWWSIIIVSFLIVGVFIICSNSEIHHVLRDKQKEVAANKDVYVSIGGNTFYFSSTYAPNMMKEGRAVSPLVPNSYSNPVLVDRLFFLENIKFPHNDIVYTVQYSVEDNKNGKQTNWWEKLKNDLQTENKTLSDLPKEFGFYRFDPQDKKAVTRHYIAADPSLVDMTGSPILLINCKPKGNPLRCNLFFRLNDRTFVNIRSTDPYDKSLPDIKSIKFWKEVYPTYIDHLKAHLVTVKVGGR